jgi:hypothetical protein
VWQQFAGSTPHVRASQAAQCKRNAESVETQEYGDMSTGPSGAAGAAASDGATGPTGAGATELRAAGIGRPWPALERVRAKTLKALSVDNT